MTAKPRPNLTPVVESLNVSSWTAFQALSGLPHVLFFDSALRHPTLGRYSYLTADPLAFFRWRQGTWQVSGPLGVTSSVGDPFHAIKPILASARAEPLPGVPPFQGGIAGLWSYDLCQVVEKLPRHRYDEFQAPELAVGLYDWVMAWDGVAERGWLISTGVGEAVTGQRQWSAAVRAEHVRRTLRKNVVQRPQSPWLSSVGTKSLLDLVRQYPVPDVSGVTSNFSPESFKHAIAHTIDYVHAGDCFQVNVAQRLLAPLREHPLSLYARLRERNPAPFGGYFDLGEFQILSASPERFVQVDAHGMVETRPIKGTRPRMANPERDREQVMALMGSVKDRAENVMIVDLLRNDLGRVCAYGTVRVPSVCQVESYQTVHHLVSVVTGQLARGQGPVDLLRAAFPGGSVTGAPKVHAMEIIAELEPTTRGPYCGSLGFIGFNGAMDTNILIRTFTVGKGWLQFPVGGGIVADSDPEEEYHETLHKAQGMLRALNV